MAHSEKNLSVIVLLIVIVAAVCPLCSMAFVCDEPSQCRHPRRNYRGPCFGLTDGCDHTCHDESSHNVRGDCDCDFKYYCYTC
ncbi:hypothetical protein CFC21_028627 [Triticum aestivum]|uniref:Defensin-like protein n=2 Tax=Triticum aestivum TaxID=4565 RepID=A0A9R1JEK3_WHEAT|nr:hypothetical protein CFC21_028627 [Triticum aestivum]